jgi:Xaa-Pro aminopeptidase
MQDIKVIQNNLKEQGIDAWIIVDYENRNSALTKLIGQKMLTRKIFLVIPKEGKPYLITHLIDTVFLKDEDTLSKFDLRVYQTWKEMLDEEKRSFSSYHKVMMDISPLGLLPRVSLADYGSVDYIKSLGIEIVSSASILQEIDAVYDDESFSLQLEADKLALQIKDEAFRKIGELVSKNGETDEYTIQQFICKRFHESGMVYDEAPIVAIGKNASDPHYGPSEKVSSPIRKGDLVLIDMWAKMDNPKGVYADITWMGYVGTSVPKIIEERFAILKKTIDDCVAFLNKELPIREVEGYEVDDVARASMKESTFLPYFIHRLGHNISVDVSPHGPGANMDNFESHDFRPIVNGTSFSLEPGIYAPDFGMRSETNVYVKNRRPVVVAGRQDKVIAILKD